MTKPLLITFLLILILTPSLLAQQNYTLSGSVTDNSNGEDLIGVTIYEESTYQGTTTNVYGFYSLTLSPGMHTIKYSFIGYETVTFEIDLDANKSMDVRLKPLSTALDEVVISAEIEDENISSHQMSVEKLDVKKLEKVPVLMGEKIAIGILEEQKLTYGENFSMTVPLIAGGAIRI